MDTMYWSFEGITGEWSVAAGNTTQLVDANQVGRKLTVQRWESPSTPLVSGAGGAYVAGKRVTVGKTQAKSAWDTQVGGTHYTSMKIQPFQFSMANKLDPMQHTIIKYVTRFRAKNCIEDLEKAKQTIDLLIAYEKEQQCSR